MSIPLERKTPSSVLQDVLCTEWDIDLYWLSPAIDSSSLDSSIPYAPFKSLTGLPFPLSIYWQESKIVWDPSNSKKQLRSAPLNFLDVRHRHIQSLASYQLIVSCWWGWTNLKLIVTRVSDELWFHDYAIPINIEHRKRSCTALMILKKPW